MKTARKKWVALGITITVLAMGIIPFTAPAAVNAAVPAVVNLSIGWNTLATPVKLHTSVDTWGELAVASGLDFSTAYRWNGTSFVWVDAAQPITPLNAIYINMNAAGAVSFTPFDGISSPPSRDLAAGWNLVGSAFLTPTMPVNEALISIYFAPGNLWGYNMAVSPGVNQPAWTYVRDGAPIPGMEIGKGYWVNMTNPATLAGFTSTP